MIIKRKTVKEYTNDSDLIELCESIWGDYIRDMDEDVLHKLISIQSHGLKRGISYDDSVIKAYETEIHKVPPVPFDIIVFRGGKMKEQDRPFLSASFYKSKALYFARNKKFNLHSIVIRKGARIIPSLYLWHPGSFSEKEVVLDASHFHIRIGYYEYI